MNEDAVIEKVRKLLALSRSTNVHEAASAAEKAHRLMLEHRLDISKITDALPGGVVEEEILDQRLVSIWRWGLLTACARNYYCNVVRIEDTMTTGNVRITASIMGGKNDVAAVKYLFRYFEAEIERLAEEKFRGPPIGFTMSQVMAEESWKRGAIVAIQDKLQKSRVMFERETQKALVLADKAREQVTEYTRKKYPGTYQPQMWDTTKLSAYESGYKAGDGVDVPREDRKRLT